MEGSKQYMIVLDERHKILLGTLLPGVLFLEIEGLEEDTNPEHLVIVTPRHKEEPYAPKEGKVTEGDKSEH